MSNHKYRKRSNYRPWGTAFLRCDTVTYCTSVAASQNFKNYYIILHLSTIRQYVEHPYIQYILVHKLFFFL